MQCTKEQKNTELGQILVMAIILLMICSNLMLGLSQVSLAVKEKIRLQISADMAILSALNCQANALNSIALSNRAIIANDALVGQINSIVCESTFYRKLIEKFRKLLRFIPYAGPISHFLITGIKAFETMARRAATLILPVANFSNIALRKSQESIIAILPFAALQSAKRTIKENIPEAKLSPLSQTLLLRQSRLLQKNITTTGSDDTAKLKRDTMDRHTLKRNWKIRLAGMSPVKKMGGTIVNNNDLIAKDRLRIKVFRRFGLRWKTVLSTKSLASHFGYETPANFLSLDPVNLRNTLSVPILIRSKMPAVLPGGHFKEKHLVALAAGKLIYTRPSKTEEGPNLFNPFWSAELTAVAREPAAKRFLPKFILKEIQH